MVKKTKVDLILHPIRMRILMALSGSQKTSQQLADDLRDVPQATLYRLVAELRDFLGARCAPTSTACPGSRRRAAGTT